MRRGKTQAALALRGAGNTRQQVDISSACGGKQLRDVRKRLGLDNDIWPDQRTQVVGTQAGKLTVLQVVEAGYAIGDRVLRPAKVGISKGGPKG